MIERQREKNPENVFIYRSKPIRHMLNNGLRIARKCVGLAVGVHDLKHTFGKRLRAAGVSFEDSQGLLGHKSSRITTHYSSAELCNLWEAANKVCIEQNKTTLTLLRTVAQQNRDREKIM